MNSPTGATQIAFGIGQVDALARVLVGSPSLYSAQMRRSLALRTLARAWAQYRDDRAITLGRTLVGAECSAERDAFLVLLERALPPRENALPEGIRLVRAVAIAPMASEAAETAAIVAASSDDLEAVFAALDRTGSEHGALPDDPLERLLHLVEQFRYSRGDERDPLSATARTPCWAINLAATARGDAFGLSESPLPFPGLVRRRLFRADRHADEQRDDAARFLREALHAAARDIVEVSRAAEIFARTFANQRSNSRLSLAWMLLFGLGGMTAAQLARALPATKAGAGKLLRQLEAQRLVQGQGPFAPFICTVRFPPALSDWRYQADR
ncbi:hypothetical protein [Sphingomonas sp. IC081]|uniref:hypothetical protein n=1 Tax=Sphingomonas sp. IC081 TaxID=304378 RepID=UPI00115AA0DF|nr:hypothetical protein [Sphingomonas sp. IC081]QDK35913.1 hypothetical protein DM450_24660 [Sphingomonas sp. IC081]QDK35970.1 hypothetical protein DM450_24965 [Sphingomonas sp. IC081]